MDHTATMRRMLELINAHDIDGFGDLVSDDFVEHEELMGLPKTKEGVKQFFEMNIAAFPDLRFDVEDMITEGDKVVARMRMKGTNTGEMMGMPATGKSIDVQGVDIVRFDESGVAVEHWGVFDGLVMMQQLGLAPEGVPAV
jgi:steroid delta-isomerase-like uncharacterized protein